MNINFIEAKLDEFIVIELIDLFDLLLTGWVIRKIILVRMKVKIFLSLVFLGEIICEIVNLSFRFEKFLFWLCDNK